MLVRCKTILRPSHIETVVALIVFLSLNAQAKQCIDLFESNHTHAAQVLSTISKSNTIDAEGYTPMGRAIENKDVVEIAKLLQDPSIDLNMEYPGKFKMSATYLYRAIDVGGYDVIKLLLSDKRVDINKLSQGKYSNLALVLEFDGVHSNHLADLFLARSDLKIPMSAVQTITRTYLPLEQRLALIEKILRHPNGKKLDFNQLMPVVVDRFAEPTDAPVEGRPYWSEYLGNQKFLDILLRYHKINLGRTYGTEQKNALDFLVFESYKRAYTPKDKPELNATFLSTLQKLVETYPGLLAGNKAPLLHELAYKSNFKALFYILTRPEMADATIRYGNVDHSMLEFATDIGDINSVRALIPNASPEMKQKALASAQNILKSKNLIYFDQTRPAAFEPGGPATYLYEGTLEAYQNLVNLLIAAQ